jgi:hypothetical protein
MSQPGSPQQLLLHSRIELTRLSVPFERLVIQVSMFLLVSLYRDILEALFVRRIVDVLDIVLDVNAVILFRGHDLRDFYTLSSSCVR